MPVEIIAEIAQGYEGIPNQAKLIVRGAAKAGADAVKFQIIYADELCTPQYRWRSLFESLQMEDQVWQGLADEAHEKGMRFYVDISGERSLETARKIKADAIKIHTTDFHNDRLIQKAVQAFKKLYISIGGITAEELHQWLEKHGIKPSPDVCIMYGYQAEPTPMESNNLRRIPSLKKLLPDYAIGFQDHSDGGLEEGMDLVLMALPYEIATIEKHITLDRLLEIEDFQSALPPDAFKRFVAKVKNFERALGSASLDLTKSENEYRYKAMKRLVAIEAVTAGGKLTYRNVGLRRFDSTEAPEKFLYKEAEAVDKTVTKALEKGSPILKENLK